MTLMTLGRDWKILEELMAACRWQNEMKGSETMGESQDDLREP